MEVICIGAYGTWPAAHGATSGYLVRHQGSTIVMDMGSGTVAKLQEHVGLHDVDAVLISHSHPDHVVDLYTYLFSRLFGPVQPPSIPLLVAPKVVDRVSPLLSDDSAEMKLAQAFDVAEMSPEDKVEVGPFRIRTAPMAHSVPTLGMRVEAGGSVIAYSADTGPTDALVDLARGADILVSEATWQEDGADRPPIHLTAREAGETAARAGVGRLLLTHLRPHLDRNATLEEAALAYEGPIHVAEEGLTLESSG